jgi:D-sedoheptulose 7-phosphate isomerase
MREYAEKYFKDLAESLSTVKVSDKDGNEIEFFEGLEIVSKMISSQGSIGKKVIFIGNGASASISSHMATDYWKNGGIRSVAFNDSSLLTCISNDFGYKYVFEKPVEMFADEGDVLMAISSSGNSENIHFAVQAARSTQCSVVTFSGFEKNNPLRSMGDYNFYVASPFYGPVEIIHLSLCHSIIDSIVHERSRS